jgi:hypothetical protein
MCLHDPKCPEILQHRHQTTLVPLAIFLDDAQQAARWKAQLRTALAEVDRLRDVVRRAEREHCGCLGSLTP